MAFSVPNRNNKLEGGEEGEGKNVHLKTHTTARGVGKNVTEEEGREGVWGRPHHNVYF